MTVTVLNRARPLVISSTRPSIRMPSSGSPVRLRNGSTATRGFATPDAPARSVERDGEEVAAAGDGAHDLAPSSPMARRRSRIAWVSESSVTVTPGQTASSSSSLESTRPALRGEVAEQAEGLGADRHQRAGPLQRAALEVKDARSEAEDLRPRIVLHRQRPRRLAAPSDAPGGGAVKRIRMRSFLGLDMGRSARPGVERGLDAGEQVLPVRRMLERVRVPGRLQVPRPGRQRVRAVEVCASPPPCARPWRGSPPSGPPAARSGAARIPAPRPPRRSGRACRARTTARTGSSRDGAGSAPSPGRSSPAPSAARPRERRARTHG